MSCDANRTGRVPSELGTKPSSSGPRAIASPLSNRRQITHAEQGKRTRRVGIIRCLTSNQGLHRGFNPADFIFSVGAKGARSLQLSRSLHVPNVRGQSAKLIED